MAKKYQNGGISELLEVKKAKGKDSLIPVSVLESLKERLKQPQGFKCYGEVQEWLKKNYGIQVAYKTVHKIVKYKLQAKLKVPHPSSTKKNDSAVEHFKKN